MKIITETSELNLNELEAFVYNHPHSNFFQSVRAFEFFKVVDNYDPILIVAVDGKEIVGSLLALIVKEGRGLKGYFSRRCIIWGGPLIKGKNPEAYSNILRELSKICDKKAIYTQFRNLFDVNMIKQTFDKHGWTFEEHLDIIINIAKPEDALWKEMHRNRRRNIKKAEKGGTIVNLLENRPELDITYDLSKEVYDRIRLPLPGREFFQTAYDILAPDYLKIFLAISQDKIIGVRYILCFKQTMYDWFAGSKENFPQNYSNDLIPWKIFLWGHNNNFSRFDFGGAGKPGEPYGVRDYKQRFGGEFVNYGRFEKVHNPFLYNFGKLGLRVWQKLK